MASDRTIVVGAGISGLAGALSLQHAGREVVVLEARQRVGGRTLTRWLPDGTQVDLGAQWVGPTQQRVTSLLRRYGLPTFRSGGDGSSTAIWSGRRHDGPPPTAAPLLAELDALRAGVDPEAPWLAADARTMDVTTFASWLRHASTARSAEDHVGRLLAGGLLATDPHEVSLLHMLFYLSSGGGTASMIDLTTGAQQDRIVGGPAALADCMAAELAPGAVVCDSPVRAIDRRSSGVAVHTPRQTWTADAVIVALPPALAGRIAYDPPLPPQRDALTQRMPMGSALKLHMVYATPFWRAEGLSGVCTFDRGPVTETADTSSADGHVGVLAVFCYGQDAHLLRRLPDRRRLTEVIDALMPAFGPRIRDVEDVVALDWSAEPYTRGCFGGSPTLGTWTACGSELRPPVGGIHWAGTETATRWSGYLEGALEAGERAAGESMGAG